MPDRRSRFLRAGLALAVLWIGALACSAPGLTPLLPTPTPTLTPAPTPTLTPTATPGLPSDTGWQPVSAGLELRTLPLAAPSAPGAAITARATLLRLDPAVFELRLHYDRDNPAPVAAWQALTGAPIVINGGFFSPEYEPIGLLVLDGERVGTSLEGRGGMLSTSGGEVGLRSLAREPVLPGEPLDWAVQGLPVLLMPGGQPADFSFSDDLARRTAVGLDRAGRLLFVVVESPGVSLYDLRDWLAGHPDLDLDVALNLDGGGSTGLALTLGSRPLLIDSISFIPCVIAFYPR